MVLMFQKHVIIMMLASSEEISKRKKKKKTYCLFHQGFQLLEQRVDEAPASTANVGVEICCIALLRFSVDFSYFSVHEKLRSSLQDNGDRSPSHIIKAAPTGICVESMTLDFQNIYIYTHFFF